MKTTSSKTVVFITGTFISNNCWNDWIIHFEKAGYTCIAPPWPYKDASPEELRNRPSTDPIATNTITSITNHFALIINALPEKPILVGHSLGGLIVQLLLQRDLAAAGVAVHSFPSRGVNNFRFSFLKTILQTMMLFTSSQKTYMVSFRTWCRSLANGLSCEEQKQSYYTYAIPESKTIIRDLYRCSTKIDFNAAHVPLLLTSGGNDKLIPPSLNYWNYKQYKTGESVTGYKEFKKQNHLVFGRTAFQDEADFTLDWLLVHLHTWPLRE